MIDVVKLSRQCIVPLSIMLTLLASGCSKGKYPDLVTVKGTVTLDGNGLSGANVELTPINETKGIGSWGTTDENGEFEIQSTNGKGAPVGEYSVRISKLVNPDGSDFTGEEGLGPMDSNARETLPARYSDLSLTQLTATVPEGGTEELTFPLKSKP